MGRIFLWFFGMVLLALLLLPIAAYQLVLDEKPMVLPSASLQGDGVMRLQRLLSKQRAQDDPSGQVTVNLTQADVDTAINYALQTSAPDLLEGLVVTLQADHATVAGCIELPVTLGRRFVNIRAVLAPDGLAPGIEQLQLGYLILPDRLVRWLEMRALQQLQSNNQVLGVQAALAAVEHVEVRDTQLEITYNSKVNAPAGPVSAPPPTPQGLDPALVNEYLAELDAIAASMDGRSYPMLGLLAPIFDVARQRSQSSEANAATENTAALVAIALYGADPQLLELAQLVGQFNSPKHAVTLTVHRRADLAKHYISSALIYLFAGNEVAEMIGLQKELDDSQSGSGFSLEDLLADKAGIRFAELATVSTQSAITLQADVAALLYDDDIMPKPSALPQVNIQARLTDMDETEAARYLQGIDRQLQQLLVPINLYHLRP
jgi:hypothetical protein